MTFTHAYDRLNASRWIQFTKIKTSSSSRWSIRFHWILKWMRSNFLEISPKNLKFNCWAQYDGHCRFWIFNEWFHGNFLDWLMSWTLMKISVYSRKFLPLDEFFQNQNPISNTNRRKQHLWQLSRGDSPHAHQCINHKVNIVSMQIAERFRFQSHSCKIYQISLTDACRGGELKNYKTIIDDWRVFLLKAHK